MLRPCHPHQLRSAGRSAGCHPMSFTAGSVRVGEQEDAASEPDSFLFCPLLLILLLYKTMSHQSSLRNSLGFSCISVWSFVSQTRASLLPGLQSLMLLCMDLFQTSHFLWVLWDQNVTNYGQQHPKLPQNLNHPLSQCGCTRDICSSTMTFSALFSTFFTIPRVWFDSQWQRLWLDANILKGAP